MSLLVLFLSMILEIHTDAVPAHAGSGPFTSNFRAFPWQKFRYSLSISGLYGARRTRAWTHADIRTARGTSLSVEKQ